MCYVPVKKDGSGLDYKSCLCSIKWKICIVYKKGLKGFFWNRCFLSRKSHSALFTEFNHDDIIKWKHFLHYWPFVRGIPLSLVDYPHNGQWCGALMFSLICTWRNSWANNRCAGDLRCHHAHYDITVMTKQDVEYINAVTTLWTHKRHLISHHPLWIMGCLLWVFWIKL